MKKFSISALLVVTILFITLNAVSQNNLTISGGGSVTVNGNLTITNSCGIPITDSRDGKTYNTVFIGNQCWLAQNMNLGVRVNATTSQTNNGVIEKLCYNDVESNCDIYGGLYSWDEMMQYISVEGGKGICPTGWHIPTTSEFLQLFNALGGLQAAGGPLKETGTTYWNTPNTGATNSSGFTTLPGGFYHPAGSFYNLGVNTDFWTSSPGNSSNTITSFTIAYDRITVVQNNYTLKTNAFSVRCLKD
jgi:uncharacterized protein (TIGR02145 family)